MECLYEIIGYSIGGSALAAGAVSCLCFGLQCKKEHKIEQNPIDASYKTKMYATWGMVLTIVNLVLLCVTIYFTCNTLPRNTQFDYLGLLVGILGVMVTLLVGWQIVSVLSIEKKVDEKLCRLKSEIEDIRKNYRNDIVKTQKETQGDMLKVASITTANVLLQTGYCFGEDRRYKLACVMLINCIKECVSIDKEYRYVAQSTYDKAKKGLKTMFEHHLEECDVSPKAKTLLLSYVYTYEDKDFYEYLVIKLNEISDK